MAERVGSGAGLEESEPRRLLLDPESPLRGHFEELAGNLISAGGVAGGVRSVAVTSPEPRSGRSSVCLGVGAALAGMGRRTVVVDCNLERPRLHQMLGEPNFVGLTSAIEGGGEARRYCREVLPGLCVLPSGPVPPDPASRLESDGFVEAVRELEEGRDLVILDAPVAQRMLDSRTLCEEVDGVLLVVLASNTSKSAARETIDDLLDGGVNLLGVVLNGHL